MKPKRKPTAREQAVLETSGGSVNGYTISEITEKCKKGDVASKSWIDHNIPKMMEDSLFHKMNNSIPYLLKPHFEVVAPGEKSKLPLTPNDVARLDLVRLARTRALDIIDHITKNEAWKNRKRVGAICYDEIRPFMDTIYLLQRSGVELTAPFRYKPFFDSEIRDCYKGIFGKTSISGSMAVPDLNHVSEPLMLAIAIDGFKRKWSKQLYWVSPTLIEWQRYLKDFVSELDAFVSQLENANGEG